MSKSPIGEQAGYIEADAYDPPGFFGDWFDDGHEFDGDPWD